MRMQHERVVRVLPLREPVHEEQLLVRVTVGSPAVAPSLPEAFATAHRALGLAHEWFAKSIPGTMASTAPDASGSGPIGSASALDQNVAYAQRNSSIVIGFADGFVARRRLKSRFPFPPPSHQGNHPPPVFFSLSSGGTCDATALINFFPAGIALSFRTLASRRLCALTARCKLRRLVLARLWQRVDVRLDGRPLAAATLDDEQEHHREPLVDLPRLEHLAEDGARGRVVIRGGVRGDGESHRHGREDDGLRAAAEEPSGGAGGARRFLSLALLRVLRVVLVLLHEEPEAVVLRVPARRARVDRADLHAMEARARGE
eukprot:29456-Pelagococcus_subviridis.AAC.1